MVGNQPSALPLSVFPTQIEIIQGLPADATITVYRVGPMVDLCSGPHLPNTSFLKAVGVTNCSRAFWRADVNREPLQRVYAITFPDKAQLKDYQHREQHGGLEQMGDAGGAGHAVQQCCSTPEHAVAAPALALLKPLPAAGRQGPCMHACMQSQLCAPC